jgi:hypothetical protein
MDMEIRYLKEGSPDCPILQMHGDQIEAYDLLITEIGKLVNGENGKLDITSLKNFTGKSDTKLIFTVSVTDIGVITNDEVTFTCCLRKHSWSQVIEKLIILKRPTHGYNWLDETSNISLLLSKETSW